MSSIEQLRTRAEAARKAKKYSDAADLYSNLLEKSYSAEGDLTPETCRDFIHYGECLIKSGETDEETFEIAWEVLENARVGYEQMEESKRPPEGLIDVHELLGELSIKQGNFTEAVSQYQAASELGLANENLSWRIPLNSLFMKAVALNLLVKDDEYQEAVRKAIEFLDKEKEKPKNAGDIKDMNEIRADLESRLTSNQK